MFAEDVLADAELIVDGNVISVAEERRKTCGRDGLGGIEFALAVGDRFLVGEVRTFPSVELWLSKNALLAAGDLYATCWVVCGDAYNLALSLGLKLDRTVPPGDTTVSSFAI